MIEEKTAMYLTIRLPDEEVPALNAKAIARGVSAEQYALEVLEQDLAAAAGFKDQIEVVDWAYNNTPGGAIKAGQSADITPSLEPWLSRLSPAVRPG